MKAAGPVNGTFALSTLLPAEQYFDSRETQLWVREHMWVCWWIVVGYIAVAHAGWWFMAKRERRTLQSALVVWNWTLAAFSAFAMSRMLPDMIFVWFHYGFRATVCDSDMMIQLTAINYWVWIFTLSKFVELLDTAFVILRKHPLTWLHWVHHALTFLVTFFLGAHSFDAGRWYIVFNLAVHTGMYSYFALKAMHVKLPEVIAKTITLLQLSQMVAGLAVTLAAIFYYGQSRPCPGASMSVCLPSAFMYSLFLVLFANFYRHRYHTVSSSAGMKKTRSD